MANAAQRDDRRSGRTCLVLLGALLVLNSPARASNASALSPDLVPQLAQALADPGQPVCANLRLDNLVTKHARLSFSLDADVLSKAPLRIDIQRTKGRSFCSAGDLAVSYVGPGQMPLSPCLEHLCSSLISNQELAAAVGMALEQQDHQAAPARLLAPGASLGGWLLAAAIPLLLAGFALWAARRRRQIGAQSAGQHWTTPWGYVLPGAAVALASAGVMDLAWNHPLSTLPWLVLVPLGLGTALFALRTRSVATWLILAISGGAALLRWQWPWRPVNWYYDFAGPAQAQDVFLRRSGGLSNFFGVLDRFLDVTAQTLFQTSLLASSMGAAVLCLALLPPRNASSGVSPAPRAAEPSPVGPGPMGLLSMLRQKPYSSLFAPATAVVFALLLALDPLQLTLACSAAPHPLGLLAFAVAFFWFRTAIHSQGWGATVAFALSLLSVACVGWTRPELAWYPLAFPALVAVSDAARPTTPGPWYRWLAPVSALGMACLAGLAPWLAREHGYASQTPDLATIQAWFHSLPPGFLPAGLLPLGDTDFNPVATQVAFTVLAILFVAAAVVLRRRGLWWLPLTFVAMTLPRLWTPFHKLFLVGPVTTWRYDVLLNPLMLLALAAGAGFAIWQGSLLWRRSPNWTAKVALLACLTAFLAVAAWQHPLVNGKLKSQDPLPFQAEFLFLQEELPRVPQASTILAIWKSGWEDQPAHDIDSLLALPNTLLAWSRPDLKWAIWSDPHGDWPSGRPLFWFESAFCQLDLDHPHGPFPAPAQQQFRALQSRCQELSKQVPPNRPEVQAFSVSPMGGVLGLDSSVIHLGLSKLAPE